MSDGDEPSLAQAYSRWRASPLSEITERLEQGLIFRLAGDLRGARVLDVGCGDGTYALGAWERGAQAAGIDASAEQVAAARARVAGAGAEVELLVARAESLPFADGAFDAVTAVTVLCFARDATAALHEMARVLRPGGRVVIGELGRWSLWAAWRRVRGMLGARRWRDARFRTAGELAALATGAGLRVERAEGAVFYPPITPPARWCAAFDPTLGARTTVGAAFIAVRASKPR
ncbi:MAG TPA: class I SAM-dependent methyltransferase [Candidatus Dormibacteraeota bacterium]|nr:class I SAM-dependent methyltransferase [Candidatus Dormibacteraeota bacterium]